jgi:Lon-like protease
MATIVAKRTGPKAEVDTLHDMLSPPDPAEPGSPPPPPPPVRRPRRTRRFAGTVAGTVVALLVVQLVIASQVKLPWVAFEPGSVTATAERLTITGAPVYETEGEILFLAVRVNRLSALEWITRARSTDISIQREVDVFGDQTPDEARRINQQLMNRSKSNAELIALTFLGYDVYRATGVNVVDVQPGTGADGKLRAGDVIVGLDGEAIATSRDLVDRLRRMSPGDVVRLDVEGADGGARREVSATLGARPDGSPGGFLGISTDTRLEERPDVPVAIDIDSGTIGGNSAGLAFALTMIDLLTPGELTGGRRVAVTGTIEVDGTVGEVGGVAQKAVAARRAGAEYLIVPRSLEAIARQNAGDLRVIPVGTLQEALDALADIGGNARELALGAATRPS